MRVIISGDEKNMYVRGSIEKILNLDGYRSIEMVSSGDIADRNVSVRRKREFRLAET